MIALVCLNVNVQAMYNQNNLCFKLVINWMSVYNTITKLLNSRALC